MWEISTHCPICVVYFEAGVDKKLVTVVLTVHHLIKLVVRVAEDESFAWLSNIVDVELREWRRD